jgi:hypothetical protein
MLENKEVKKGDEGGHDKNSIDSERQRARERD